MFGLVKKGLVVGVLGFFLFLPGSAWSRDLGLLNSEVDGNPSKAYAYEIVWPSGTTSITAGVLTYTPSGGTHDALTLSTDLGNNLLGLSTQQLTLDNQNANVIFAGPTTGAAAAPSFRSLVAADVPTLNQNTTGTAAGLTAQYIDWNSSSGGSSIANKPTIGDVTGPASSTDNTLPRFNGTGGKTLQAGQIQEDDSGNVVIPGTVTADEFISSAADGAHVANLNNTIAITATATSGHIGNYNGEMRVADGSDWNDYFMRFDAFGTKVNRYHQTANFAAQTVYADNAGIVVLDPKTAAAITISEIAVYLNADPTQELTITLYHKTAAVGYTGGTQIDANDTVAGTFVATSSFDDATIPAGSKIWLLIGDDPDDTTTVEVSLTGSYD